MPYVSACGNCRNLNHISGNTHFALPIAEVSAFSIETSKATLRQHHVY
jgi:hypothetical protein